ncbi:MAG: bifunctional oligoribonuclease/PAP phosphatase NrnA [Coprobacillus sp.]|nr:bifunctional oligoribonuclease/PAP phosphatase NrnA [Coprobacillus sp.]
MNFMKEYSAIEAKQYEHKPLYKAITAKIKEYNRICIFRHNMPDYDALGSQVGLAYWIKDNFEWKEVMIVGDNHVTFTPRVFPAMDEVGDEWFNEPFLAIILDSADESRVSDSRWRGAEFKIKIDHHPNVDSYGDIELVDTDMASLSELVVDLVCGAPNTYISKEAASNFFIGMIGDSGRFRYPSTNLHTFETAEMLIGCGIDINELYLKMYEKNIDDLRATAYVLNHFFVSEHGVAYYILPVDVQNELKITTERGKENVNLFENINGINAWCSVTEDPKDHCWRISIRSKEKPINGVASLFEGGGHPNAAGAKIWSLDDLPRLIDELDKLFMWD